MATVVVPDRPSLFDAEDQQGTVGVEGAVGADGAGADGAVPGEDAVDGGVDVDGDGGGGVAGVLAALSAAAAATVAVDPGRVHPDELAGGLRTIRRARNRLEAAESAWLAQVRARRVHRRDGAASASAWAREAIGASQREAADKLRTAERLKELADTAGAFRDGRITGEAASAIGDAMADERLWAMDDVESELLDAARRGGPDEVRRTARRLRATADRDRAEADAARKRALRRGQVFRRGDGMVRIDALLDPDNGEPFLTAFEALFDPKSNGDGHDHHFDHHDADRAEGQPGGPSGRPRPTPQQRTADVLGEMARRLLAGDGLPDSGGMRPQVIVTVPLSTLRGEHLDDGPPWLRLTGPIDVETARRMACQADIIPVVLDGRSVPIDIGRTVRLPTAAQRRCLLVRDRGCRLCGAEARVCIPHHCVHWVDGGPTDLTNLVLLCWACHQLVHDDHWTVRWRDDNHVTFTHPDGRTIIRPPPV